MAGHAIEKVHSVVTSLSLHLILTRPLLFHPSDFLPHYRVCSSIVLPLITYYVIPTVSLFRLHSEMLYSKHSLHACNSGQHVSVSLLSAWHFTYHFLPWHIFIISVVVHSSFSLTLSYLSYLSASLYGNNVKSSNDVIICSQSLK